MSNTLSAIEYIEKRIQETNTALIATVVKVNENSIDVQPVTQKVITDKFLKLPVFKEVPLINLQGGDSNITFPVKVGDFALLIINDTCFDNWFDGDNDAPPSLIRMNDYSDAFAIVGINNRKGALPIPKKTTIQGDLIINGDVVLNGNLTVNGKIHATGNISTNSDISTSGVSSLNAHTHGGIKSGGSNTTQPTG